MKQIILLFVLTIFVIEESGCASKKYCKGGRQYYKKM